jgi:hypothetical protein
MDTALMAAVMERNFEALNDLTDRLGMTMEQNEKISKDVIKLFFPEYPEN